MLIPNLTDEWIKMWYIYSMEYYLAVKKNEIILFTVTWIDLEIIILRKVSQKRQTSYGVTCMWNLKYSTNQQEINI